MRQLVFIISGLILFYSCQNKENDKEDVLNQEDSAKVMITDSLPDAEWNGEYMKIKDADEPDINRKSIGSEYYKIGNVTLKIGNQELTFINFLGKKNVLSFTKKSITAFITSGQNEQIHLQFYKEEIRSNYKGKYRVDPDSKGKTNATFTMTVKTNEKGKKQEYTLETGKAEMIKFTPELGAFVMNVKGNFTDQNGIKYEGKGEIKMNFENVAMTAP